MHEGKLRTAVLWSGGVDSTLLIWNLLEKGEPVTAFYVRVHNNKEKDEAEFEAVQALTYEFKTKYPGLFLAEETAAIEVATYDRNGFVQPQIWVFAASFVVSRSRFKALQIGYVMGDQMISYLDDLRTLWKSLCLFSYSEEPVPLEFPLWRTDKRTMRDALPKHLRELTVFCEYPNRKKPCGRCSKCDEAGVMEPSDELLRSSVVESDGPVQSIDFWKSSENTIAQLSDQTESL